MELGHGGFMHGVAANSRLLKHYMDTIGAKPTGAGNGYGLYIDEKAAARLLEKYSWTTT